MLLQYLYSSVLFPTESLKFFRHRKDQKMELKGAAKVSSYLPDTYAGKGGHDARRHYRDVGEILQEKPDYFGGKPKRAKEAGRKQRNVTERSSFVKIWMKITRNQIRATADQQFDKLSTILPDIDSRNMTILAIATKYRNMMEIKSNEDWSADNERLIEQFQGFGNSIWQDATTSGPTMVREALMKDVLRYIKSIVAFENAADETRRARIQQQLEDREYEDDFSYNEDEENDDEWYRNAEQNIQQTREELEEEESGDTEE